MISKNPIPQNFHHVFQKGAPSSPALLLLHGTGGNENDLLDLGKMISPTSSLLSPRGKILENGMPRFFKRLAEGVFDLEDLHFRTNELADFILEAKKEYDLEDRPLIALGFSNGANIAASMLLQRPEILDGAILLRAMTPFEPKELPDLKNKKILMLSGKGDQIIPTENASRLARIFEIAEANIDFEIIPATHQLTQIDVDRSKAWLKL